MMIKYSGVKYTVVQKTLKSSTGIGYTNGGGGPLIWKVN